MDQFAINLIVLGKSGVGKSSFCNYLFDRPGLFETGSGKPVTDWEHNFQSHTFTHQSHLLNVFDSVDLEADNYEQWLEQFDLFMQQRCARPMEPETWIHCAFYVINASSARLENVDLNLIKRLASDARIPLQVVLTNADVAGDKIEALKREIHKFCPEVSVTPLCSVSVRKRGGQSTQAFGRDEVLSLYLKQSHIFLCKRLAALSCLNLKSAFDEMRNKVIAKIQKADLSLFNIADLDFDKEIDLSELEGFFSDLRSFDDYLLSFGFAGSRETSDELEGALARVIDDFHCELDSRFKEIDDGFKSENLMRKVGAYYDAAKIILTMKSTLINWIDGGTDRINKELDRLFTQYADQDNFFDNGLVKGGIIASPKRFGLF